MRRFGGVGLCLAAALAACQQAAPLVPSPEDKPAAFSSAPCSNLTIQPTEPLVLVAQDPSATRTADPGWPASAALTAWLPWGDGLAVVTPEGRVVPTSGGQGLAVPAPGGLRVDLAAAHPTDGSLWALDLGAKVLWRLGQGEKAWRPAYGEKVGEPWPEALAKGLQATSLGWAADGSLWLQAQGEGPIWRKEPAGGWRQVLAQAPSMDRLLPWKDGAMLGHTPQGTLWVLTTEGLKATPWSYWGATPTCLASGPEGRVAQAAASGSKGAWSVQLAQEGRSQLKELLFTLPKSRRWTYTLLCSGDPNEGAFPLEEQPRALAWRGSQLVALTTKGQLHLPW